MKIVRDARGGLLSFLGERWGFHILPPRPHRWPDNHHYWGHQNLHFVDYYGLGPLCILCVLKSKD